MEILLCRRNVHLLARAAAIGVRRRMQRLMYVADEMNEKCEVAGGAPFVIVAIAKPAGVLIDFCRDAISIWAPRRHIALAILQADVDVVPRAVDLSSSRNSVSGRIDAAAIAFSTEPASAGTPRICATCDLAVGVRSSAAMTATISCPSANQAHAGRESSNNPKARG